MAPDRPWTRRRQRAPVTVALAVAIAVVLAGTLHSAADELERTTPRRWAGWRAEHATAAAAVGAVLPAAVYEQFSLLRNTAGLLGLALLAAAVIGPRLAWSLPLGHAGAVYLLSGGIRDDGGRAVWAFVRQPAASSTALVSALLALASSG